MPPLTYAIILAGGYGTRFWPLSRRVRPKQLLPLAGKESLLQLTYRRVARLFPRERIYVVGNAEHRALLRRQLPRVPRGRLLLEPVGRNTTAAIALAAQHITHAHYVQPRSGKREPLLGVFPADHAIRHEAKFGRLVRAAFAVMAEENVVVTLGIPPTHPQTGYGYIERSRKLGRRQGQPVYAVRRFTEKPDARTAARYLRTRRFFWNSGMFFFRLWTFQGLLSEYLPRTAKTFEEISSCIGYRQYKACLDRLYPRLQNISVDYAVAEPAAAHGRVRVIPADIGWSDLGSWAAIYDWRARRRGENILAGPHFLLNAAGNWLDANGKFVAAIGVDDLVVVDTPDALLLCSRSRAQDVRKVVNYLEQRQRRRLL